VVNIRAVSDTYAYVTLTTPNQQDIRSKIAEFVDRLQALDENLPLRTVPLEIQVFTPVQRRMDSERTESLANQERAVDAWGEEIQRRFEPSLRALAINDVPLQRNRN